MVCYEHLFERVNALFGLIILDLVSGVVKLAVSYSSIYLDASKSLLGLLYWF